MVKRKNIKLALVILSFLIEAILIYLILSKYLSNDTIAPHNITFYEYIKTKFLKLI